MLMQAGIGLAEWVSGKERDAERPINRDDGSMGGCVGGWEKMPVNGWTGGWMDGWVGGKDNPISISYREGQINALDSVQKKAAKFANHTNDSVWGTLAQCRKI